jgi:hypothetical protein
MLSVGKLGRGGQFFTDHPETRPQRRLGFAKCSKFLGAARPGMV